jgi:hypothetical protein
MVNASLLIVVRSSEASVQDGLSELIPSIHHRCLNSVTPLFPMHYKPLKHVHGGSVTARDAKLAVTHVHVHRMADGTLTATFAPFNS